MAEVVHRFKPGEDIAVKAEAEQLFAGRLLAFPVKKSAEGDYLGVYPEEKALRVFGATDKDTADPKASPAPGATAWTLRTNVTRAVGAVLRLEAEGEVKVGEEVMVAKKGKVAKASETKLAIGIAATTGKDTYVEVILY